MGDLQEQQAATDGCNDGAGIWRMRRRFMAVTTGFCMAVVAYVLHYDMQSSVAETAVTFAFITITSTVGSYVFGATWDDHNARTAGTNLSARKLNV